jgi:ribosome-associated protein
MSKTTVVKARSRATRKAVKAAAPESALNTAHLALDSVESKKASQIVLLDVRTVSMFTDYFLLCNGESERQIKAIAEGVDEALAKARQKRVGREGTAESGWVLLDYGDVTVHIFAPEQRDYYQLEELWKDAQTVVKIQ